MHILKARRSVGRCDLRGRPLEAANSAELPVAQDSAVTQGLSSRNGPKLQNTQSTARNRSSTRSDALCKFEHRCRNR